MTVIIIVIFSRPEAPTSSCIIIYKQRKILEQKSLACKIINLDLKQLPQLNKLRVHSLYLILVFNGKRTVRFAQSPIQTLCMNVSTLFI